MLAPIQDVGDVTVRPLSESDLANADHIMRVAFGTYLGVPDPVTVFGDSDHVKTRLVAAPDCAWAAEIDGEVVGSNFATRWGSFAFFGPLTVRAIVNRRTRRAEVPNAAHDEVRGAASGQVARDHVFDVVPVFEGRKRQGRVLGSAAKCGADDDQIAVE